MSLLVPARRPSHELLDGPGVPTDEMVRSLHDIGLVNRWGGEWTLVRYLAARLPRGRTARLLDVGAGSCEVARRIETALRRRGRRARVVAIDRQWQHLAAGRRVFVGALPAVAADALRLPFPDQSFDWAFSTLVFHHFSPEENVAMLREAARVARGGIAVLDLRRHLVPLLFVRAAGPLFFRSPVSIADGAASVRQAYTPAEAQAIAARALPRARVAKVFPFRLLLSAGPSRRRPRAKGSAA